jgi:Na+-translocating ferredoxin:NAD+ oxidoreductase subunit E
MSKLECQAEESQSLWQNNPVLVQLLGLSPVLAVSTSLVNGIGLGIATFIVMLLSCISASLLKAQLNSAWRFTWFLLIMASYTTALDILMQWLYFPLYKQLGIYIPLICCNIAILVRMEVRACNSHWKLAATDAAKSGVAYLLAIVLLAGLKELIGQGTLFSDWQLLIPSTLLTDISPSEIQHDQLFGFAKLQPMAFILLGIIVALKNFTDSYFAKETDTQLGNGATVQRARVTGRLKK